MASYSMYRRAQSRYEACIWDNTFSRLKEDGQIQQGRQVYLGTYDTEENAARSYDLASLKLNGSSNNRLNFPIQDYKEDLEKMASVPREKYFSMLKEKANNRNRIWQARIKRGNEKNDNLLGAFDREEEDTKAYNNIAAIRKDTYANTNFDLTTYDVEKICSSPLSPKGGAQETRDMNLKGSQHPKGLTEGSSYHHNVATTTFSMLTATLQETNVTNEAKTNDTSNISFMGTNLSLKYLQGGKFYQINDTRDSHTVNIALESKMIPNDNQAKNCNYVGNNATPTSLLLQNISHRESGGSADNWHGETTLPSSLQSERSTFQVLEQGDNNFKDSLKSRTKLVSQESQSIFGNDVGQEKVSQDDELNILLNDIWSQMSITSKEEILKSMNSSKYT